MVINIAASTRFHLANLVVELERMGHDVRFYSYVPPRRLMSYGLSQKSIVPLFWLFYSGYSFVAFIRKSRLEYQTGMVSLRFCSRPFHEEM